MQKQKLYDLLKHKINSKYFNFIVIYFKQSISLNCVFNPSKFSSNWFFILSYKY